MSEKITIELDRDTAVIMRAWLGDLMNACSHESVASQVPVHVPRSVDAVFTVLHSALVKALTANHESYIDESKVKAAHAIEVRQGFVSLPQP